MFKQSRRTAFPSPAHTHTAAVICPPTVSHEHIRDQWLILKLSFSCHFIERRYTKTSRNLCGKAKKKEHNNNECAALGKSYSYTSEVIKHLPCQCLTGPSKLINVKQFKSKRFRHVWHRNWLLWAVWHQKSQLICKYSAKQDLQNKPWRCVGRGSIFLSDSV